MKHLCQKSLDKILARASEFPHEGTDYLKELEKEVREAKHLILTQMSGGSDLKDLLQRARAIPGLTKHVALLEALAKLCVIDRQGLLNGHQLCTRGSLRVGTLADAFGSIENENWRVTAVYLHPKECTDLREEGSGAIAWEGCKEVLHMGLQGRLWAVTLLVSQDVPEGRVWVVAAPDEVFPEENEAEAYRKWRANWVRTHAAHEGGRQPSFSFVPTEMGLFNPNALTEIRVERP